MRRTWLAAVLVAGSAAAAGCASTADATPPASGAAAEEPATVEPIEGTDLARVRLTEDADTALGIQTRPVTAAPGSAARRPALVVPYSAVVYDADGQPWVFTSPEPRTYVRAKIAVGTVRGDTVTLSAGPRVGTRVVTVGAAELVGAEAGIDGEE